MCRKKQTAGVGVVATTSNEAVKRRLSVKSAEYYSCFTAVEQLFYNRPHDLIIQLYIKYSKELTRHRSCLVTLIS